MILQQPMKTQPVRFAPSPRPVGGHFFSQRLQEPIYHGRVDLRFDDRRGVVGFQDRQEYRDRSLETFDFLGIAHTRGKKLWTGGLPCSGSQPGRGCGSNSTDERDAALTAASADPAWRGRLRAESGSTAATGPTPD